jgi:PleD family two-component response regulator
LEYLEKFRKHIEENILKLKENSKELEIRYTISMGVELELNNSLKEMIILADGKLYKSKEKGKNSITF